MENTTENNKLFAEFMEYFLNNKMGIPVYYNDKKCELLDPDKLLYHSDWNWLMEVLEKIKNMGYFVKMNYLDKGGYIATDHYSTKTIIAEVNHKANPNVSNPPTAANPVFINEFDEPKEVLYNLILRFIKWYNQQKN